MIVRCGSGMVLPNPLHIWIMGRINGHLAGCSKLTFVLLNKLRCHALLIRLLDPDCWYKFTYWISWLLRSGCTLLAKAGYIQVQQDKGERNNSVLLPLDMHLLYCWISWHVLQCLIWVYTVCSGLSVPTLRVITLSIKGTCLVTHYNSKKWFSCCC